MFLSSCAHEMLGVKPGECPASSTLYEFGYNHAKQSEEFQGGRLINPVKSSCTSDQVEELTSSYKSGYDSGRGDVHDTANSMKSNSSTSTTTIINNNGYRNSSSPGHVHKEFLGTHTHNGRSHFHKIRAAKLNKSPMCTSSNIHGKYSAGGGCNIHGCYPPDGGCNMHGCWMRSGKCDFRGCVGKVDGKKQHCRSN